MNNSTPFSIYDAAAGSGKTFTLVKEYNKILLKAKSDNYYKYILAITFTNRAVAEMKQRIIDNLILFTEDDFVDNPSDMAKDIASETGLSLEEIQTKSKRIITHLLHNYSSFSVETIDSFNHRLIRTFARDLQLSGSFEVSLETDKLLAEAVDLLISKAGETPKTTKVLIDYTLEKTDDDRSWDISKDISKTAKLIFNENDTDHIKNLQTKKLGDFLEFKKQLVKKRKVLTENIITIASETLKLIDEAGLEFLDFSSGYLPKHFVKLASGNFDVNFDTQWINNINEKPLYSDKTLKNSPDNAAVIGELTPLLSKNIKETKQYILEESLLQAILRTITPLSVINLVINEIETIKEEKNILPISEFNKLINAEIKDQPTPFIYERLGEKYRHFFIDEFQDTSKLQWKNIEPLINNSISQEYPDGNKGSLMLVGDAKQSIYRWRGGLPEQFIDLCNEINPFSVEKKVFNLPTNYRSRQEIVAFNNDFFTFASNYLNNPQHKELYKTGNQQKHTNNKGGYVKMEFIDSKNKEESHEIYAEKALETIINLLENGFQEKDICILTRNKKDGISIGSYLQENEISIVSSETLLLDHSSLVQFLINCLTLSLYPNNDEVKINVLEFLYQYLSVEGEKHSYFVSLLKEDEFTSYLKETLDFSFSEMHSKTMYDSLEYCIRKFNLSKNADAYLYGFMDVVFEFEQKANASKISFLEEWEFQKEKASIPVSEQVNGVQLMTIHKAKGLEFPVVIFPYADVKIYYEKSPSNWINLKEKKLGFDETHIETGLNSIKEFGKQGEELYQKQRETLELDNLNLLYVTLTRAEKQLYIFANRPTAIKKEVNTYNQFFGEYLKSKGVWEEDKMVYEFGSFQKNEAKEKPSNVISISPFYYSSSPETHNLQVISKDAILWDTEVEKAIFSGTIVHEAMEKVISLDDIPSVFEALDLQATITSEDKETVKNTITAIVNHPDLNRFYNATDKIKVESKIISKEGNILIPDRINIHSDNSVSIIDYKTGAFNKKHENQINAYGLALKEMNYKISEKILIYSSSEGIVINKV
ncbi:MAG: hypothetical protein COB12_05430 [Flavobacterium sp.]|nr:MAG: hypothetical protein COB12_05430 [Flavobacterium sp.]